MIRIAQEGGWLLIGHQDHARLAGRLARHWNNAQFSPPQPLEPILAAVSMHDDAWALRDREPFLTPERRPSAFSSELVGTYDAFEEIDLADYLQVRGQATEAVAQVDAYAAIIVSMHTVNLLTEQADLSSLSDADREVHACFIDGQRKRQEALAQDFVAAHPEQAYAIQPEVRQRAFEFLQACDSLSLVACVRFPRPIPLRHQHPNCAGERVQIMATPLGDDHYRLEPYPFDQDSLTLEIPCRHVPGETFDDLKSFRAAYADSTPFQIRLTFCS